MGKLFKEWVCVALYFHSFLLPLVLPSLTKWRILLAHSIYFLPYTSQFYVMVLHTLFRPTKAWDGKRKNSKSSSSRMFFLSREKKKQPAAFQKLARHRVSSPSPQSSWTSLILSTDLQMPLHLQSNVATHVFPSWAFHSQSA